MKEKYNQKSPNSFWKNFNWRTKKRYIKSNGGNQEILSPTNSKHKINRWHRTRDIKSAIRASASNISTFRPQDYPRFLGSE
jgi:hypothetical protein